jgi:hypothetical protein
MPWIACRVVPRWSRLTKALLSEGAANRLLVVDGPYLMLLVQNAQTKRRRAVVRNLGRGTERPLRIRLAAEGPRLGAARLGCDAEDHAVQAQRR